MTIPELNPDVKANINEECTLHTNDHGRHAEYLNQQVSLDLAKQRVEVLTTNGGPHGHVHAARNLRSSKDRPCSCHAFRNLKLARPMDNQAI